MPALGLACGGLNHARLSSGMVGASYLFGQFHKKVNLRSKIFFSHYGYKWITVSMCTIHSIRNHMSCHDLTSCVTGSHLWSQPYGALTEIQIFQYFKFYCIYQRKEVHISYLLFQRIDRDLRNIDQFLFWEKVNNLWNYDESSLLRWAMPRQLHF